MVGNPNEIEPSERREHGQDPDHRRASVFDPCVEKNAGEQDREDELGDHRCKLWAERSTRIDSELPSFWPFASKYALYSIVTGTSMYLSLLGEDLVEKFRGVCHSVLPQPDRARPPLRHRPQAIVGVGQGETAGDAREPGRCLE